MKYFSSLWALLLLLQLGCASHSDVSLIPAEAFSDTLDGRPVSLYTLSKGDIVLQVTNYGGRVVSLFTPDRDGKMEDIVVGHASLDAYVHSSGERFFGACVGPVANRIAAGTFSVDGQTFHTPCNDRGNTLHGGLKGLDKVVWDVVSASRNKLVLHYVHPDGEEGFPGNLDIRMTYKLTADNEFHILYTATTDKATPVNLSHHPFFNLKGEGNGSIEDAVMQIFASHYTPVDSLGIPTGVMAPVAGTPFDFTEPHPIGARISEADEQICFGRGYDHNWCIDRRTPDALEPACAVYDPENGRCVEVISDQPGLQFYSGNFFDGSECGKYCRPLTFRSSFVLEAQRFPDAPNQPGFPSIILRPGDTYSQHCIYRFSVRK